MDSKYVLDLYKTLEKLGMKIWIDGGWAVDALLKKQTRPHEDLDVAVEDKDLKKLHEYLEKRGYMEIERDKNKKWDWVLRDSDGHEVEAHSFSFDNNNDVIEENYWDGYSADSLSGIGVIDGEEVRCVSLQQLIKTHNPNKRRLKDADYKDMKLLSDRFNIE
jgi:lincosamide nucleotidyltransferase A/C/D/E